MAGGVGNGGLVTLEATYEGNPEGPATGEVENKEEPGSSKTILGAYF